MRFSRTLVAVLGITAGLPCFAAAANICDASTRAFIDAQELEAKGDIDGAYRLLQPCETTLGLWKRQHLTNLRALVITRKMVTSDHIRFAAERANSLRQIIAKLDPVRDVALFPYAHQLLKELDTEARGIRATRLAQVLGDTWTFAWSREWLAIPAVIGIILLVALLGACLRLRSPRYEVSFEDLTEAEDQPKDPTSPQRKDDHSKQLGDCSLTQDLEQAFWVPRVDLPDGSMDDLHIDAIKDHDGSSFGSLVPQAALIPGADLVQGDNQLQVASVKVSLRPPWLLLSSFFRPRSLRLVGYLHNHNGQMALTAQLLKQKYKTRPLRSWNVVLETTESDEARYDLTRNLAAQILVDLELSKLRPTGGVTAASLKATNSSPELAGPSQAVGARPLTSGERWKTIQQTGWRGSTLPLRYDVEERTNRPSNT